VSRDGSFFQKYTKFDSLAALTERCFGSQGKGLIQIFNFALGVSKNIIKH